MGGFHAKIRLDKTGLEEVMVLQWPRKMTDSGEKNTGVCYEQHGDYGQCISS